MEFAFLGGVSRGEMPHPIPHVVQSGHGCPWFLGPRGAHREAGLTCDDSRALAVTCLCEGAMWVSVFILHWRSLCTIMGPPVSPRKWLRGLWSWEKEGTHCTGRKAVLWQEAGRRAVWGNHWRCVDLGRGLSCGASNCWSDSSLGTSHSGCR